MLSSDRSVGGLLMQVPWPLRVQRVASCLLRCAACQNASEMPRRRARRYAREALLREADCQALRERAARRATTASCLMLQRREAVLPARFEIGHA